MKKVLLLLFCAFGSSVLFSQNTDVANDTETDDPNLNTEVFTIVEEMPEFPGGDKALYDFLEKNLKYPEMAKEQGIQGKVWMGFTVQKDGMVTDIEILRGIGGGCDQEALRVLKLMPQWKPAKQAGKEVACKFRIPVNFTLR